MRWPLHPQPCPGEALTSWLERIADVYDMPMDALVRYNLGAAGFADDLDRDPLTWAVKSSVPSTRALLER